MKNFKVDCQNQEISLIVQKHLLENGCEWDAGDKHQHREYQARFLYVEDGKMLFDSSDEDEDFKYDSLTLATIEEALSYTYKIEHKHTADIGGYQVQYEEGSEVFHVDTFKYEVCHARSLRELLYQWDAWASTTKTTKKVKVDCKNSVLSKCVQDALFENGFGWTFCNADYRSVARYLFLKNGYITTSGLRHFNNDTECSPISIEEALELKATKAYEAKVGCSTVKYKEGDQFIHINDDKYKLCDINKLLTTLESWSAFKE